MILKKKREKNIMQKENKKNVAWRKKMKAVKDKNLKIEDFNNRIDISYIVIPK